MAHRSRLSQAIARQQLSCIICGCTEDRACITENGPCHWVSPGLCSNPECLQKFEAEFGSAVDVLAGAQDLDDFARRRAEDFLDDEDLVA
jgi:hypothetical protein